VKMGLKISLALTLMLLLSLALTWQKIHEKHMVHSQIIQIKHGSSLQAITKLLHQHGIISSPTLFRLWVKWQGKASSLKAGEFRFSGNMAMPDVLQQLLEGKAVMHSVTIAEGLRTVDILNILAKQTHVDVQHWQQALDALLGKQQEGYLLPETYHYSLPVRPKALLKTMLDAQSKILSGLDEKTAQKVRIMASIIEKETALNRERPWVAAVIRNRLHLHMPLQMDPTVIYGIWKRDGVFSGNIHRHDLHWNSYTRKGLPPTPICNPGAASLKAAMHPADVNYLYFVADGTGGHAFASTLSQHQRNVAAWIRLERQR